MPSIEFIHLSKKAQFTLASNHVTEFIQTERGNSFNSRNIKDGIEDFEDSVAPLTTTLEDMLYGKLYQYGGVSS